MKLRCWYHLGFHNLLFWMLVYLVVSPFLTGMPSAAFILGAFFTAVLLSAIYAARKTTWFFYTAVVLLTVALISQWISNAKVHPFFVPLSQITAALYFSWLVYGFFEEIFRAKKVNADLIAATLCLYLVLGVLWGTIYSLLEALIPGSFSGGS